MNGAFGRPSAQGSAATLKPGWDLVDKRFEELRNWGFGWEEVGAGYRRRLKRLCRFILDLQSRQEARWPKRSPFKKLQTALKNDDGVPTASSLIQQLDELRKALEELQRRDGESEQDYLTRLQGGLTILQPLPGDGPEIFQLRKKVEKTLKKLGVPPANGSGREKYLPALFKNLRQIISDLADSYPGDRERIDKKAALWQECFQDCLSDWEWAYVQVLVRLARECLKRKNAVDSKVLSPQDVQIFLRKAIPKLEEKGFLQAREQGLYDLMAESCLACTTAEEADPGKNVDFLRDGLAYARRAVELEPESVRERLGLIRILSVLQDYEEMKAEAEIALNLDPGPETLRAVGSCFWKRSALLPRRACRKVLREASIFFEDALRHVESEPFNEDQPLAQAEAHGWAHFWLGRFQGERGRYTEAIRHLRTASALGFKPLESRVELAWACYLSRDLKRANLAFQEAAEEAERHQSTGNTVAQGLGEERTLNELEFDTYLGWALLSAERDQDRARERIEWADTLLQWIARPSAEDLKAALDEARGRAYLSEGEIPKAVLYLEQAVQRSPRGSAYCYLGFARIEQARNGDAGNASEALRRAEKAYRLAREADVRGRHLRELWDLRRQLRQLKAAQKRAATPADPQAPNS